MSNTTPNYYTINSTSIFSNAVKYYFGEGSPNATYYLPIGDDTVVENPENDIRVQKYTSSDLYTEPCILSQFCIGGAPIVFIKKGTFPKLGSNSFIWGQKLNKRLTNANYNITAVVFRGVFDENHKLTNYYIEDYTGKDKDNNDIGYENKTGPITVVPNELTGTIQNKANADNFDENTSSDLPSRIGFVIVGGGGGAGGGCWFKNSSSGNGDGKDGANALVPGAGGGGGAIATGVFNFSYPEICFSTVNYNGEVKTIYTIAETYPIFKESDNTLVEHTVAGLRVTDIEFHIAGGRGGAGNGGNTTRGDHDERAKNGETGREALIYVKYHLTDGTNTYVTQQDASKMPHKIFMVNGGNGGAKGDYSVSEVSGGAGGAAQFSNNSPALWQVGAYAGGSGVSVRIDSDKGYPGSLESYSKSLHLTEETPPLNYRLDINHAGASVAGYADSDKYTGAIYGGHSYGYGGQVSTPPTKGGGGGFLRTTEGNENKFENRDTSNDGEKEPTDGAHGYFAIYY